MSKKKFFLILRILTGSFLYAVGFNVFVVPFGLFSGGAVGAAQLICIPVARAFRLNAEQFISIVYILLNICLLYTSFVASPTMMFFTPFAKSISINQAARISAMSVGQRRRLSA